MLFTVLPVGSFLNLANFTGLTGVANAAAPPAALEHDGAEGPSNYWVVYDETQYLAAVLNTAPAGNHSYIKLGDDITVTSSSST
jgi:hypothetical protein